MDGNNDKMSRYNDQEADLLALEKEFNRWSRLLIQVVIAEQEAKLLASDMPVEGDARDEFWREIVSS